MNYCLDIPELPDIRDRGIPGKFFQTNERKSGSLPEGQDESEGFPSGILRDRPMSTTIEYGELLCAKTDQGIETNRRKTAFLES